VLGAAIAAALLFSTSLLPGLVPQAGLLLGLLALASPFPLMVKRLRGGVASATMAAVIAALLVATTFSAGQAAGFLLMLAAPGLLIGEAMARGRGLVRGCAWAFVLLSCETGIALFFAGPQMAERVIEPVERYRSARFLDEMRASGMSEEQVTDWAEQLERFQGAWEIVYPAAFLIMGALVILVNAALLRAYLARRDPGWLDDGEFESIRWPLGLAVAFVMASGAVAVPTLRPAAYNVLLFLAFFFALQGLAVVVYYAHRLAGPPLLRTGLLILVLLNPWAPQILALLGLFDIWFDFRRWAEPPQEQAGE
jgi:uncharacterized protein YybS (DUF2232 family)